MGTIGIIPATLGHFKQVAAPNIQVVQPLLDAPATKKESIFIISYDINFDSKNSIAAF